MIKLTFCLRRRDDLSAEEFYDYWKNEHAPLVQSRAAALGVIKYQQVHTLDEPKIHAALQRRNGGSPAPFDGIAEIWVRDLDTFMNASASSDATQAALDLITDEKNFIDLERSPMWLGVEHVFVDND